jgi:hypothetical protein
MPANTNTPFPATPTLDVAALPNDALITPAELAGAIKSSESTLANWRTATRQGKPTGPKFIKLAGSMIRYRAGDVRAFIGAQS